VKLDQENVEKICKRVVDHNLDTQLVADQFSISRRRIQQLAKKYRETGSIPEIETTGRSSYRDYPGDLEERVVELHNNYNIGAVAIAHILRVKDDLAIANNKVHDILLENDSVTRNKRKQGRQRPWVRWERDYSLISVHLAGRLKNNFWVDIMALEVSKDFIKQPNPCNKLFSDRLCCSSISQFVLCSWFYIELFSVHYCSIFNKHTSCSYTYIFLLLNYVSFVQKY